VPVVTAVRPGRRGRVLVELDGAAWRELPAEAVAAAALVPGLVLDRERLRRLRRELRRREALGVAGRALAARDASAAELEARLRRRGVPPAARREAQAALERAGLLDDGRFAERRADALARRGAGDALIRDDLERRGIERALVERALAALEPEHERAARLVASGRSARWLAARGFAEETVAAAVANEP
jgi:SOS response regulatory protein OraA/RecX